QEKMLDLLAFLKQGDTYDEALTAVYGFDINGLDARWRATLTSGTVLASEAPESHSALIAALAALAIVLVVWGVLTLRKRARQRSSGVSTVQDKS
ncbi:MAG TPA: peptidase MA family metallohydrolase, partial [Dehalococcoidia bacterium]|nr:peptidase MA family metallohydrolase [Dehalococcoidia bacterium]